MTYFSKYRSQIHHIKYYSCYPYYILIINYFYPLLSEDSDNKEQYNYHYTKSSSEKQPVYTQINNSTELFKNDNIIVQKIEDVHVNKLSITWDDDYNEEDIIQLDFM